MLPSTKPWIILRVVFLTALGTWFLTEGSTTMGSMLLFAAFLWLMMLIDVEEE